MAQYILNKEKIEDDIVNNVEVSCELNISKANEKISILSNALKSKSKDAKIIKKI